MAKKTNKVNNKKENEMELYMSMGLMIGTMLGSFIFMMSGKLIFFGCGSAFGFLFGYLAWVFKKNKK